MIVPIVIAYGTELREGDTGSLSALEHYLGSIAQVKQEGSHYEYCKGKTVYDIRIVFAKGDFLEALDMPNAIVIYEGHSRYGQGPAFHELPLNPWENYFLMGWDVVKTRCKQDILLHCTNPVEYSATSVPKSAHESVKFMVEKSQGRRKVKCESKLIAKRKLIECFPDVATSTTEDCQLQPLLHRHYWQLIKEGEEVDFWTLVLAGSEHLGKSQLGCAVLFLNSCSSHRHFYHALRTRKRETGSKCVFYLTKWSAYPGLSLATVIFVRCILERGINPTRTRGARKLCTLMNGVSPGIRRKKRVKLVSGEIGFYPR